MADSFIRVYPSNPWFILFPPLWLTRRRWQARSLSSDEVVRSFDDLELREPGLIKSSVPGQ